MSEANKKSSTGLEPNVAGLLCYLVWWVTGLIFLLIEKESQFVRFHAIQSIATSVVYIICIIILSFIPIVGWIINIFLYIGFVILWIICMVKAYKGQMFKLPIVGNFAEKNSQIKPAA